MCLNLWHETLSESARYSAFGHMAAALFLKPDDLMALLVPSPLALYGDASGKEEDPILSVGGLVGRTDEWLKFEPEWNAVLNEFGVPYFHMREFAHSVDAYAVGWKGKEAKRKAFIDGLVKALAPHAAYWMGACVVRADYLKVDAEYELHEYVYPYTLCAKFCVDQANLWRDIHWPTIPVEYVFECGDPHRGQLKDQVHSSTGADPIFRNRKTVPLQAADFAAYEVLKLYRRLAVEMDKSFEKCRESFKRLWEISAKWGQFEERDLRILCRTHDVARRTK